MQRMLSGKKANEPLHTPTWSKWCLLQPTYLFAHSSVGAVKGYYTLLPSWVLPHASMLPCMGVGSQHVQYFVPLQPLLGHLEALQ